MAFISKTLNLVSNGAMARTARIFAHPFWLSTCCCTSFQFSTPNEMLIPPTRSLQLLTGRFA
ncbi:hypothetical protein T02_4453 [Trichinella nativa]|uniref:Uncharacterized protein n=1 Tax=Trichinella nativa TaxID=6335 RepID=A0A0V1LGR9_9BILA|nr:hypothetical protein T02_4453 [Trichinella nativa]